MISDQSLNSTTGLLPLIQSFLQKIRIQGEGASTEQKPTLMQYYHTDGSFLGYQIPGQQYDLASWIPIHFIRDSYNHTLKNLNETTLLFCGEQLLDVLKTSCPSNMFLNSWAPPKQFLPILEPIYNGSDIFLRRLKLLTYQRACFIIKSHGVQKVRDWFESSLSPMVLTIMQIGTVAARMTDYLLGTLGSPSLSSILPLGLYNVGICLPNSKLSHNVIESNYRSNHVLRMLGADASLAILQHFVLSYKIYIFSMMAVVNNDRTNEVCGSLKFLGLDKEKPLSLDPCLFPVFHSTKKTFLPWAYEKMKKSFVCTLNNRDGQESKEKVSPVVPEVNVRLFRQLQAAVLNKFSGEGLVAPMAVYLQQISIGKFTEKINSFLLNLYGRISGRFNLAAGVSLAGHSFQIAEQEYGREANVASLGITPILLEDIQLQKEIYNLYLTNNAGLNNVFQPFPSFLGQVPENPLPVPVISSPGKELACSNVPQENTIFRSSRPFQSSATKMVFVLNFKKIF